MNTGADSADGAELPKYNDCRRNISISSRGATRTKMDSRGTLTDRDPKHLLIFKRAILGFPAWQSLGKLISCSCLTRNSTQTLQCFALKCALLDLNATHLHFTSPRFRTYNLSICSSSWQASYSQFSIKGE